jgi:hypothetical protein
VAGVRLLREAVQTARLGGFSVSAAEMAGCHGRHTSAWRSTPLQFRRGGSFHMFGCELASPRLDARLYGMEAKLRT